MCSRGQVLDALLPAATAEDLAVRMRVGAAPSAVLLTPLELAQVLMLRERGPPSRQAARRCLLHYTAARGEALH